jgi:hypothetical protein
MIVKVVKTQRASKIVYVNINLTPIENKITYKINF